MNCYRFLRSPQCTNRKSCKHFQIYSGALRLLQFKPENLISSNYSPLRKYSSCRQQLCTRNCQTRIFGTSSVTPIQTSFPRSSVRPASSNHKPSTKTPIESTGTDIAALDVLGDVPGPAAAVEVITASGFKLSNGIQIADAGVLLLGGEAFRWRPWLCSNENGAEAGSQVNEGKTVKKSLKNKRGQWEVDKSVWGALEMIWPKPGKLSKLIQEFLWRTNIMLI